MNENIIKQFDLLKAKEKDIISFVNTFCKKKESMMGAIRLSLILYTDDTYETLLFVRFHDEKLEEELTEEIKKIYGINIVFFEY